MGPKIEAAISFVENSKKSDAWAIIGDLKDAGKLLSNEEGTIVKRVLDNKEPVIWRERKPEPVEKPPRLSQDPPAYA
jgi:carbamate kinase